MMSIYYERLQQLDLLVLLETSGDVVSVRCMELCAFIFGEREGEGEKEGGRGDSKEGEDGGERGRNRMKTMYSITAIQY